MSKQRRRLDLLLVERGAFASRQQALGAIMAGLVFVNGERVDKAGTMVSDDADVGGAGRSVVVCQPGRAETGESLETFGWDPAGVIAVGHRCVHRRIYRLFAAAGAMRVYAVDVGYGQLHWRLRNDPRVVVMERTNARHLQAADFPEPMDWAVMDVSFISLEKLLPAVVRLLKPDGRLDSLVKPQFEAGPEHVGRKASSMIRTVHRDVLMNVLRALDDNGFQIEGLTFSPVRGPKGNIEYLAGARQLRCRRRADATTVGGAGRGDGGRGPRRIPSYHVTSEEP